MAQGKPFSITAALTNGAYTTDIFRPPTGAASGVGVVTAETFGIIKRVRIVNGSAGALTFRLYRGATGANAAGTNVVGYDVSVAAGGVFTDYPNLRFDVSQYLVGGASGAGLVIEIDGELFVA